VLLFEDGIQVKGQKDTREMGPKTANENGEKTPKVLSQCSFVREKNWEV